MQTARAARSNVTALPPAPAPKPLAEYVLIGPGGDLEAIAQAFAGLDHQIPTAPTDIGTTQEVPTVRIRVWNQPDGRRLVEVHGQHGETASVVFKRAHLFVR